MDNSKPDSKSFSDSDSSQAKLDSKVQEIKLSNPKNLDSGFVDDFKLFLVENSNLVIGVSIGTLILVFGVLFAVTSNQSFENNNILSEIASSSTGALISDSVTNNSASSESPPTLVAKSNQSTSSNSGNNSTTDDEDTVSSNITLPPLSIQSVPQVSPNSTNQSVSGIQDANLANQSLGNQSLTGNSPFAGGSAFAGTNSFNANQNIQNLSANVPSASANLSAGLGNNPNVNRTSGFLSNTQSQVLQSQSVQGNTGPAVYYTLAFSFLASFLYRLRKKKTN